MAKILIVDDEEAIRDILKIFLGYRHKYLDARDGVEAITVFEKERPDLVIMDIRMPRMSGIEAVRKIKEIDPNSKIIVLTAFAEGKRDEILNAGTDKILEKPLRKSKIVSAVEELLK
jgi:YesN/AraC family two-component response regulator